MERPEEGEEKGEGCWLCLRAGGSQQESYQDYIIARATIHDQSMATISRMTTSRAMMMVVVGDHHRRCPPVSAWSTALACADT